MAITEEGKLKKLTIEALADYTYLSGLKYSNSGAFLGYVAHQGNLEENNYKSDIWIASRLGNEWQNRQLSRSGKASNFTWLKHVDVLLYASTKDDEVKKAIESLEPLTAFYTLDPNGGESELFMKIPISVSTIESIDDDRFFVLGGYHEQLDAYWEADETKRKEILSNWKDEQDYEVVEEIPFWSNGGSYTRGERNRLYIYTKSTQKLEPITGPTEQVDYFSYDEKYQQIIVISAIYKGKMPLKNRIVTGVWNSENIIELTEVLAQERFSVYYAYFSKRDEIIFLGTDGVAYGLNQNGNFYILKVATQEVVVLTEGFDISVGSSVGSDARFGSKRSIKDIEGQLYFVTTQGGSSYLNQLSPDGQIKLLTNQAGSVDDFDVKDADVAMIAMRENRLGELYILEEEQERAITNHNDWVYKTYQLSTPEPLSILVNETIFVDGWVMKPIDFDPNKKYPSILNIHGGPKTVYGTVFYHEMQYWANEGFIVYFCNPRGSDGKGNDFSDIRGCYGTIDYEDLMAFTDEVINQVPQLDINRMFVTGGSYGGFMTNWIVGHTHRFKAAAAQRSISNWTTEYGVTDIGYYFVPDQTAADPWTSYEKLWEQSPLKYADQVKTPLLLIHSDADYRCWLPEALQMFTALKDFGVETRLCVFKGENHELSRSGKPKHRIRRIFELTKWFKEHDENI